MQVTKLNEQFSVSEQIQSEDVAVLSNVGVQTIVCNRPDGESEDQTNMAEIKQAAAAAGVAFVEISFAAGQANEQHVKALAQTIATGHKIHAYCRTGTRSQKLWQQVQDQA